MINPATFVPKAIGIGVVLVVIALLLSGSCAVVPPGNRGIAVTLGKVQPMVRGEGLTGKMPMITHIELVSIRQETSTGTTPCFSSDLQTVTLAYTVMTRIPEGKAVELFQQFSGKPYESLVVPRLHEAVKQVTAKYTAEEAVKRREEIRTAVLDHLRKSLNGIVDIRDFNITNIDLSDDLEKAIERKQVEEQRAKQKEYELQSAKKQAEITITEAQAEAESVRIKGEALKNSPTVIDLEIVKKWDGKTPETVVTNGGGASMLLPLKK